MTQAQFRIGGIYRDGYGDLCRIQADTGDGLCQVECLGGRGWESYAFEHRLRDGRYWRALEDRASSRLDLIPGEVDEKGEPIAPTFYASIEADYRELKAAAALMEWLGKHMPASLAHVRSFAGHNDFHSYMRGLTGVTQEHFDSHDHACAAYLDGLMRQGGSPVGHTTKPAVRNDKEWIRPRLTWADKTPFDKFSDFAVSTDANEPDHAYSHPTTRIADAGAQVAGHFGSAELVR